MKTNAREQRLALEEYLKEYLDQDRGVRLGETTVISHKVHANDNYAPGIIRIYKEKDAGQYYLRLPEEKQILHVDVFHEPASLDPVYVAQPIRDAFKTYVKRLADEQPGEVDEEQWTQLFISLAKGIYLQTSGGKGSVYDLSVRKGELIAKKAQIPVSHVHVLAEIPPQYYDCLIFMVDAIEKAIQNHGYEIRRVEKIIHCKAEESASPGLGIGISLPGLNLPEAKEEVNKQNRFQIILDLTAAFGSLEEAARFLEALTPTGNMQLPGFAKKHTDDDLKQTLLDLQNSDLIKQGRFFTTMTKEGKELLRFMRSHQQELEAQVRKSIRHSKIVRRNYKTYHHSLLKSKKCLLSDEKKVLNLRDNAWYGSIAIPETVVHSAARSYLEGVRPLRIKKEDLHQYGQKSFAPIDTLLAIDCSGSMVGEKIRAVSYLAEHFLLTSREKIGVVTFQERSAQVAVPFTKNYRKLEQGLMAIRPAGITPLAHGIVESVNLVQKKRARNPLMILITDGVPNFPLWTTDAQADGLTAAKKIAEAKICLVCIGVLPNENYMQELALAGQGNLYVVEELNRDSLVDVVTTEWQRYKYSV